MADEKKRVRILRTVLGENDAPEGGKEILVKGSVVDLSSALAAEFIMSNTAEDASDAKLLTVDLHP